MKTIRLVIFNEDYWSKGLIFTQNIRPLIELSKEKKYKVEIISFTPFLVYLRNKRDIRAFQTEISSENVLVRNFFTCYYPTRYMITKWYLLPFLFFNTFIYILYLRLSDRKKDVKYNLRSYEAALAFYLSYDKFERLFFDTRTDWIEESINAGYFLKNSLSEKMWLYFEKQMVSQFSKTIFISEQFRTNVIERHNLEFNPSKYVILYNPIDFGLFNRTKKHHNPKNFLYTGSFGGWNRLELYLDFFKEVYQRIDECKFIICTSTSKDKVEKILKFEKYSIISNSVEVNYNVPNCELPNYYSQCDFGLQLMSKKDSRIGVKVVEYIAAGIVPIVSENVQGAAQLVSKYDFGIVVRNDDTMDFVAEKISSHKTYIDRNGDAFKDFQSMADLNGISNRLDSIYSNGIR